MQKKFVKYSLISLLLLIYINRGLFVSPHEIENHGVAETNSIIEWVLQLVTGESNDIDEDGDMQSSCNFTLIYLQDFPPHSIQVNLFPKDIKKNKFFNKENFIQKDFYDQIDRPPEMV